MQKVKIFLWKKRKKANYSFEKNAKGIKIHDNYGQICIKMFKRKTLYCFEKKLIDFIIRYNNVITPVEVKSADNTKSKLLYSLMNNYNVTSAIKLSSKNVGVSDNGIISLPLYMSMFL